MRYIDSSNVRVEESYSPIHTYTFTGPCLVTGQDHSVTIAGANLFRFRQTDDIMDLGLDADDREFVISGSSPEGFNQLFGSDDE
jgi:hypothetical protein